MSDERRYTDDEVAEIIQAASTPVVPREDLADPTPATGLTLDQLQAIGREVGIAPERIAQAAAALDRRDYRDRRLRRATAVAGPSPGVRGNEARVAGTRPPRYIRGRWRRARCRRQILTCAW